MLTTRGLWLGHSNSFLQINPLFVQSPIKKPHSGEQALCSAILSTTLTQGLP